MNANYGMKYKPVNVKPVLSKMFGPISLSTWEIGGQHMIDTQYEYQVTINANIDRKVPKGSHIDCYSTPTVSYFGSVGIRSAGIHISTEDDQAIATENATRCILAAEAAMIKIKSLQYTDLDIINVKTLTYYNLPVIFTYQLALMRMTPRIVLPLLHYQSFLSLLESLKDFNTEAAYRVDRIKRELSRTRVTQPLKSYLDLLSAVEIHKPTFEALTEFIKIEKLNDAINTSYDYVSVDFHLDDDDILAVTNVDQSGKQELLADTPQLDNLYLRDYIERLVYLFTINSQSFEKAINPEENYIYKQLIIPFITAWNEASNIAIGLPTIYAPYYTALSRIDEFIDPSVFGHINVNTNYAPIRRASYYSVGHMISRLDIQATTTESNDTISQQYPTFSFSAPLYNGSLVPNAAFNSNGVLLLNTPSQLRSTYYPFVDISKLQLTSSTIATQYDIDKYLDKQAWTTYAEPGFESMIPYYLITYGYKSNDNIDTFVISPVKASTATLEDVYTNPLSQYINYLAVKQGYVALIDTGGIDTAIMVKSPIITGYRPVTIPTNVDDVIDLTTKIVGLKPTIPLIR